MIKTHTDIAVSKFAGVLSICIVFGILFFTTSASSPKQPEEKRFESQSSKKTGINFKNQLTEDAKHNILTYEYFFNGGGVAIGDINNDGLDDIYFTANMEQNALYLNKGDLNFEDITKKSGTAGKGNSWTTGTVMADVNGDGLLDIYVCYSGKGNPDSRRNELFINQGNLTFKEMAAQYGLDDPSFSTQAAFFDFDKDGDLDMYLLNHNTKVINESEFGQVRNIRDPYAGDKLYENQNGHFVDISEKAGIKGNPLGFGLGVAIADINADGWPDIYISNDYIETDYLYINNGDGTFTDRITDYLQHISHFSMGDDIADVNNDGRPDIFTLDMLPEDNARRKLLYIPENYQQFIQMIAEGFYLQNMRNMLQVNNGNGTFSEIGQLAGVSNTDWSWAPLFADFDNDGWKDLFVTNGYYRDYTDHDFLKRKGNYYFQKAVNREKPDTFELANTMTSTPVRNYMFRNNGDLTFSDVSKSWGFEDPIFSNGAGFSDLDNDGDLDLVVNNLNDKASILQNMTMEKNPKSQYLSISLQGINKNTKAVGSEIRVYTDGNEQFQECMPFRGFQSSMSYEIHFGIDANITSIDSIMVTWPEGQTDVYKNITPDQKLELKEKLDSKNKFKAPDPPKSLFSRVDSPIKFQHEEYGFNDFKRQPLLLNMLTHCGPIMAVGDINGDKKLDVFVGGAKGTSGKIFVQRSEGLFVDSRQTFDQNDILRTDAGAIFFDADGDGDADLYIASGGYEDYQPHDLLLQDRLYINNGFGSFSLAEKALPPMLESKSCVKAADFDGDGDIDLFVGSRVTPGQYPVPPKSYLLQNDGSGHFTNIIATSLPDLEQAGMITDATWTDVNHDNLPDLVVVGEFMPIQVFVNISGSNFKNATNQYFNTPLTGLWTKMIAGDFDHDGDDDFVIGNFGLNSQMKVNQNEPLELVYKDFDHNGTIDPIFTSYIDGKAYPMASRDELINQIYSLNKKFTTYASYANAQLSDIFSPDELKDATVLKAETLKTIYLENKGDQFIPHELPIQAQFAPVYAITTLDYNDDGNPRFYTGW